jgi:hypothetical protein
MVDMDLLQVCIDNNLNSNSRKIRTNIKQPHEIFQVIVCINGVSSSSSALLLSSILLSLPDLGSVVGSLV